MEDDQDGKDQNKVKEYEKRTRLYNLYNLSQTKWKADTGTIWATNEKPFNSAAEELHFKGKWPEKAVSDNKNRQKYKQAGKQFIALIM